MVGAFIVADAQTSPLFTPFSIIRARWLAVSSYLKHPIGLGGWHLAWATPFADAVRAGQGTLKHSLGGPQDIGIAATPFIVLHSKEAAALASEHGQTVGRAMELASTGETWLRMCAGPRRSGTTSRS